MSGYGRAADSCPATRSPRRSGTRRVRATGAGPPPYTEARPGPRGDRPVAKDAKSNVSIQAFASRVLDPESLGPFPRLAKACRFSNAASDTILSETGPTMNLR